MTTVLLRLEAGQPLGASNNSPGDRWSRLNKDDSDEVDE